ncbi:MAG: hypothetical protein GXP55_22740, partial [Deltaproteobacteria bacterium]|nr:hypothetical protein [Deltaproteobacteria bacterium]
WQLGAAREGREAFVARFSLLPAGVGVLLDVLLLAGLLVHVGAGVKLVLDDPGPRHAAGHASAGSRSWQRLTGVLAFAFVLFHVFSLAGAADALAVFSRFDATLGQPRYLLIWVLGLTAIFAHLAEGVPAALRTLGLVGGELQLRRARVLSGLLAAFGWLLAMNSLSYFATGAAYVGGS